MGWLRSKQPSMETAGENPCDVRLQSGIARPTIARARSRRLSFIRTLATWVFTVAARMTISAAIFLLESPRARSSSTCTYTLTYTR
jgi:hypothetical protein